MGRREGAGGHMSTYSYSIMNINLVPLETRPVTIIVLSASFLCVACGPSLQAAMGGLTVSSIAIRLPPARNEDRYIIAVLIFTGAHNS